MLLLILLLPLLLCCHGWHQYEESISINEQAALLKDGTYEFTLVLEPKLSMSEEHQHKELSIHDYDPESMAWLSRDKDQLNLQCLSPPQQLIQAVQFQNYTEFTAQVEQLLPHLLQMDGRHRRVYSINGTSPGPTLVVPFGAEVLLRVKNRLLLDSVTLHIHGLEMKGVWFNGGVGYVQQCPIPSNSDYSFRFIADQVGTHWYHGQFPHHQNNGLLGAFIVIDPNEKQQLPFQRDYVVLMQDWPIESTYETERRFLEGTFKWNTEYSFDEQQQQDGSQQQCAEPSRWHGRPDPEPLHLASILINQKGWHNQEQILKQPSQLPLTTYRLKRGEDVRLRLIHGGYEHPLVMRWGISISLDNDNRSIDGEFIDWLAATSK